MPLFYQLSTEQTLQNLNSSLKGIPEKEAIDRSRQYGKNILRETNKRSTFSILLSQFMDLLVIILIVAGVFSWILGEMRDVIILFLIVIVNALIGFFQEYKSERLLDSMKHLVKNNTKVIREGKEREIFSEDLVPGDIVVLEEGDGVPADIRLISSNNFATNDCILTGEVDPQKKKHDLVFSDVRSVTDQDNCIFMGVTVARGDAKGVVFATGMQTEIGKIAHTSIELGESASPLQQEITSLAKTIAKIAGFIAVCIFVIRFFFSDPGHNPFQNALLFSIAVAAAMVPQGLPAEISTSLSLAIGRLSRKKALIKKMTSVETLGASSVIASDKTGTITKNEMTITNCFFNGNHYLVTGTGYEPKGQIISTEGEIYNREKHEDMKIFFLDGYLASTGSVAAPDQNHKTWYALGDPTESAFATLALKIGLSLEHIDYDYQQLQIFPFDSDRKRMSIIREHKGKKIVFAKGGIESILAISTSYIDNKKIIPLSGGAREKFLHMVKGYSVQGLRVLAVAYKDIIIANHHYNESDIEKDLIFSGFVTMSDPPHDEVKQAVQVAFDAHVKVVMITGDNDITASAIANRIGMVNEQGHLPVIIRGEQLAIMPKRELQQILRSRCVIFSRVTPSDKLNIVKLLQQNGEIVAVTGDGVNDALSLKKADIGVSMGLKGSEVAREASDMILLDDNFSTIVIAIKEGRTIYRNLEKVIIANLNGNFGELTCVLLGFVGMFFGLPISILAVQILAIDLVAEMFPLMALTFDPPEDNIMKVPPRDVQQHVVNKTSLYSIIFYGFLKGLSGYMSFLFVFLFNNLDKPMDERIRIAHTVAYMGVVLAQFANILSLRTRKSIFSKYLFSNTKLIGAYLLSFIAIVAIAYVPWIHFYLQTAPLSLNDWLYPIAGAVIFLGIQECIKYWFYKKQHI